MGIPRRRHSTPRLNRSTIRGSMASLDLYDLRLWFNFAFAFALAFALSLAMALALALFSALSLALVLAFTLGFLFSGGRVLGVHTKSIVSAAIGKIYKPIL